jgi:pilus assembly protein CpaB
VKRRIFFILAIVFALIAAGSVYVYLKNLYRVSIPQLKPLVVANSKIPARSLIKADQLTTKNVPLQGYPQGGFSDIQSVVGSAVLVELDSGDPVLESVVEEQARPEGTRISSSDTARFAVPEGKRAVSIPISLVSGVGYAVRSGDYVDVLSTMDIKASGSDTTQITITTLAAQDVQVLSVGAAPIVSDKEETKVAESKYYTLALTVPQALAVTLASEKGSLRLALRNPVNTEIRGDQYVNPSTFLEPDFYQKYR